MTSLPENDLPINTLSLKPGIPIWYSNIPEMIRSIFCKGTYHNYQPMVNEIFQKDDFIKPFFSDEEILSINRFKALKKQLEWISGRCLIKQMIQHLLLKNTALDHITFAYQDEGAPFLVHAPDIPVSLSHSAGYTAAACAVNRDRIIGIDIERIAKKPDIYFLKTAFTQNEILHMTDDALDIFRHWTIKEAYLKYIKKGFNESLHAVEVINNEIWHHKKKMPVDITSTVIDGYVLSLVSD